MWVPDRNTINMSDTKLAALALITQLKLYDVEYAEGEASVSDKEYDALRKQAQALDPGNAYFTNVGSDVRGGKEKLPYVMGSLDQIYNQNEWDNWVRTYNLKGKSVVVTDKQDGISAMLIYRHGKLEKAYSRGNGMEGADISRHVRKVSSVPKDLSMYLGDEAYLAVRAELIMPVATFDEKYAATFKNPRNMVAGCFNRSTTEDSILRDIRCIAYQVVAHSGMIPTGVNGITPYATIDSKTAELRALHSLGFMVTPSSTVKAETLNDVTLRKLVAVAKAQSETELDGVVVTIDKYEDVGQQRRSTTTLNPEHSIKYKVSSEGVETEVVDVLWELSKSAFFKPRVQVKPVSIGGVTITYATGFNGKFIYDNGIGPGAKVKITRQGDVIPYIDEVILAAAPKMPTEDWDWNENGVEIITTDDNNADVKFKQILSFVETMKVEQLKESSLREAFDRLKMKDMDYASIVRVLFDLTDGEWVKLLGANGAKIATSIRRRGENMTHEIFLGAVKYLGFGFGVRKAKALLSQMPYADLLKASEADIAQLDGFDVKTAQKVFNGIQDANALLEDLVSDGFITLVVETKTSELKAFNVVFTGFRDPDLEKAIELSGGKVGSSVSSKTTHLLTMDPKSNSGKAKKARDLGVAVMSPEQFKDEYNL
jgi:DNA ligase (NAD+)